MIETSNAKFWEDKFAELLQQANAVIAERDQLRLELDNVSKERNNFWKFYTDTTKECDRLRLALQEARNQIAGNFSKPWANQQLIDERDALKLALQESQQEVERLKERIAELEANGGTFRVG